ncbi:hypothetical protein Cni_G27403 [Canna indica]|uniref:NAC domain-containing protein n=1 Tax=Canna indica TaxID=4628 RepID=A0AAQ3QMY0_9LILI|nr:hypothetical protein Cni_G27403 [Canna indica]
MEGSGSDNIQLPGFRFHPTEEELLDFYLKLKIHGNELPLDIISTVHLYRHDPWELPGLLASLHCRHAYRSLPLVSHSLMAAVHAGMAKIGEREWYFYVPRDRRQASGGRPSRTTARGFWKATGSDRPVRSAADPKRLIGLKKTLVYYEGRAPRGCKTDWVMNEYRLPDSPPNSPPKEDVVLCKIYKKATSMKELEQRAAAMDSSSSSPQSSGSFAAESSLQKSAAAVDDIVLGTDVLDFILMEDAKPEEVTATWAEEEEVKEELAGGAPRPSLPVLEVPVKNGLEWFQDPFLTQLRSPWVVDSWSPYANMLNC